MSKAYDSDQMREWVETVERSKYIDYRDLQDALLEYADEYEDESRIRHKSLGITERANKVTSFLQQLIKERTPEE